MKLILFLLLLPAVSFSQEFQLEGKIGQFKNASSFYINSAGFIYVTDTATDEITAFDNL